jgi:hypothetical protein
VVTHEPGMGAAGYQTARLAEILRYGFDVLASGAPPHRHRYLIG